MTKREEEDWAKEEPLIDAALIAVAEGLTELELRRNPELMEWRRNILENGPTPSEPPIRAKLFLVK